MQSGNWSGQEYFFPDQTYELLKADASTLRRYANSEGKELYLFISYFKSQKYGSQIILRRTACREAAGRF